MQRAYIWPKTVASPHHQRFLRLAHTWCPERGGHGECYYASLRGIQCNAQRFLYRSHTHSCTTQSGEQKASANKASSVVHIFPHLAAGSGVLNVVGCSSEGQYMFRRLHNTAATSHANRLLRRMEIALHCVGYAVRFAGSQADAECKADEIRH